MRALHLHSRPDGAFFFFFFFWWIWNPLKFLCAPQQLCCGKCCMQHLLPHMVSPWPKIERFSNNRKLSFFLALGWIHYVCWNFFPSFPFFPPLDSSLTESPLIYLSSLPYWQLLDYIILYVWLETVLPRLNLLKYWFVNEIVEEPRHSSVCKVDRSLVLSRTKPSLTKQCVG